MPCVCRKCVQAGVAVADGLEQLSVRWISCRVECSGHTACLCVHAALRPVLTPAGFDCCADYFRHSVASVEERGRVIAPSFTCSCCLCVACTRVSLTESGCIRIPDCHLWLGCITHWCSSMFAAPSAVVVLACMESALWKGGSTRAQCAFAALL